MISGSITRFIRLSYLVIIGCTYTRKNTHAVMLVQDEIFYLMIVPIRLNLGTQVSKFNDI